MRDPSVKALGGRNRVKVSLDSVHPVAQEQVARWILAAGESVRPKLEEEAAWVREHPDDTQAVAQLTYYQHVLSVSKWLATMLRKAQLRGGGATP